jgi:hypothetical protein
MFDALEYGHAEGALLICDRLLVVGVRRLLRIWL